MIKFRHIIIILVLALLATILWNHYGFNSITDDKQKNVLLALGGNADKNFGNYQALIPMHQYKRPPQKGDWLDAVKEEGQTFDEFVAGNPRKPSKDKQTIYITLIGDFDEKGQKIVKITANYIKAFFGLPVAFNDPVPLSAIPSEFQRINSFTRNQQVLAPYVLEQILKPNSPKDAYINIALTSIDLWPGKGWNFVFGLADPEQGLGVWSIYRNGNPNDSYKDYALCLRRTISTAVHEIAHMLGMHHCIFFECALNGSNHRRESDTRPLVLCPICLRKLHWVTEEDMPARFERLKKVCHKNNFIIESSFYERAIRILNKQ